jgi:hypothetical protein
VRRPRWQYQADYPERARPPGTPLKWRSSRKVACLDLQNALKRHMINEGDSGVGWTVWAYKLGAGLTTDEAPDGTLWQIVRRRHPDA